MKIFLVFTLFAMLLLSQTFLVNQQVFAHNANNPTDPPGPSSPKIRVYVVLDGISLNQDMDDGGGDAELVLTRLFAHKGHNEHHLDHMEIPFDWDLHRRSDSFAKIDWKEWHKNDTWRTKELESFYYHDECSPMSEILYAFDLKESDQSTANTVASGVATLVGAGAAVPGAGWVAAGIIAAVGSGITFLIGLNGDEDLGSAIGSKYGPEEDIVTTLSGPDGTASVYWSIYTVEIPDPEGECTTPNKETSMHMGSTENQSVGMANQNNSQEYALATQRLDDFIDSSKQLILLNPTSVKEKGLTDISDEEFLMLKEQTPAKVVKNADRVFLLAAKSTPQNNQKDNALEKRDQALLLLAQGKYIESLDLYHESFLKLIDASKLQSGSTIPDWLKTNADWWSKGLISDKEFATGLGFLVKEKIIQVENVSIDSNGSLVVSENVSIPKWIRTNAQWWVDGAISDEDFKQGIQFMVKEKIIDFSANKDIQKTNTSLTQQDYEYFVQLQSNIILASNIALEQLLELQNFVASSSDDSAKNAWDQYSETKDNNQMQSAIQLETQTNFYRDESLKTVNTIKDSNRKSDLFFEIAKENGFDDFKLKQNAENELQTVDAPSKIRNMDDFENAENNLKQVDSFIKNTIKRAELLGKTTIGDLPDSGDSQSSRYSFSFGSSELEDSTSRSHGIDSLTWAKTCTSDSACDSSKGEQCTKRNDNAEVQCIPTWFGIKPKWTLVSPTDSTDDDSDSTSQSSTSQISVLIINGGYFPISQFATWQWEGECDDATHYHTDSGHAISVTLQSMGDPDPNQCGFGKVSQLPVTTVSMSDADVQGFLELTSIDPRNNEATFGGSGP